MLCLVNFSCLSETIVKMVIILNALSSPVARWFYYHLMPANYLIPVLGKRSSSVYVFKCPFFLFISRLFGCFNPFAKIYSVAKKKPYKIFVIEKSFVFTQ